MDLSVTQLLHAVYAELAAEGTTSRELAAIEFDPNGNVDVLTREEAHVEGYPDLVFIFGTIGQTCEKDRIGAQQLRRISFLKEEFKLELISRSGDQEVIYSYPIEATTKAPNR
jgi:hypothetical protein